MHHIGKYAFCIVSGTLFYEFIKIFTVMIKYLINILQTSRRYSRCCITCATYVLNSKLKFSNEILSLDKLFPIFLLNSTMKLETHKNNSKFKTAFNAYLFWFHILLRKHFLKWLIIARIVREVRESDEIS